MFYYSRLLINFRIKIVSYKIVLKQKLMDWHSALI
jgi:hypothetical protein